MSHNEHIYHMTCLRACDCFGQSCLYNRSIKSCLSCECMRAQDVVIQVICQALDFAFSDRSSKV